MPLVERNVVVGLGSGKPERENSKQPVGCVAFHQAPSTFVPRLGSGVSGVILRGAARVTLKRGSAKLSRCTDELASKKPGCFFERPIRSNRPLTLII